MAKTRRVTSSKKKPKAQPAQDKVRPIKDRKSAAAGEREDD